MKKINYICIVLFLACTTQFAEAQIGNLIGINYQAVAIDENGKEIVGMDIEGKPLYNKTIGVRFTISTGSGGPILFQETHTVLTDQYGLFSLVIGLGTNTGLGAHSVLMTMPWIDADQWLGVEISTKNDGNYKLVSLQQFMTVPYSFYTDDIADSSITSVKIVDETIQAIDIATGAVTTSEILNETILAEDIGTGSVETSEILDLTILNEDIANGTINLTTKVTGILPVPNGGTGNSTLTDGGLIFGKGTNPTQSLPQAIDLQIPVGVTASDPVLKLLVAGTGIVITNTADSVIITSGVTGINSSSAGSVNVGAAGASTCGGPRFIGTGLTWISPAIPLAGVVLGNLVIGSISNSLQGCQMTTYVDGSNVIRVSIFNGTGTNICFPSNLALAVLVVQ